VDLQVSASSVVAGAESLSPGMGIALLTDHVLLKRRHVDVRTCR
jgi:hypothetical protein